MTAAKTIYKKNIEDVSILTSIYDYLRPNVAAFDISELLRSEYVLCISALDRYVHHRVREGLVNAFHDITMDPGNTRISLKIVRLLLNENDLIERERILDAELQNILSRDSYQSPTSIESAFCLINVNKIWSKISPGFGKPADDIKNELALIINRRNKIAHESDVNFATGLKEYIDRPMLQDTKYFINKLVDELEYLT
jgi:hypothetical protein